MPHFTLEHSDYVDEEGLACESVRFNLDNEDLLDYPWLQGVAFASSPPSPIVLRQAAPLVGEPVLYDYLKSPVPLVSMKLKQALEAANVSNVQYFATQVISQDSEVQDANYWAINVVGMSLVADPQHSASQHAFGQIGADIFSRFAPRPNIEPELRVFRMAEHQSTVIIDHHVVKACTAAGIDTLDFVPLEQWLR